MKKTYLFDFDGTLVDSMPVYGGVMLDVLKMHGIDGGEDILKIITPLGYVGTAQYYIKLGVNKTVDELTAIMLEKMVQAYTYDVPAKKNVIEVLKQLKGRGHSLNVLTASPHETLDACLKRLGIFDLFDNVWSCNDFVTTKADVKIYHAAARKLGVQPSEIIFLDDNLNADVTAKKAGLTVYGVYDDSSAEYRDEIIAATDRYITDFNELL